jgi:polysaccharide export outer membrane protein
MVSLSGPLNVMQLISIAGGLTEYAKGKEVRIFREENGVTRTISFNYETFQNASNTKQNIELRPGDIVDVP